MASSLLSRTLAVLRPIRSSACAAHDSRKIFNAFSKRIVSSGRSGLSSLVSPSTRSVRRFEFASTSLRATTSAIHTVAHCEPVVSADWLLANLRQPDVKILDASWYMPDEQRNPFQEYQMAHIPGALFFDVDGISDRTSNLPHMLPSEEAFAAAVSALGIYNTDGVVVYDGKGIFSAARVWWMFRVFGHDKVWVLDGGLPQWRASGYDVESSASGDAILKASAASEVIEKVYHGKVGSSTFEAKFQPHLVWKLEQVKQNIEGQAYQHIDARSKARMFIRKPRTNIKSMNYQRNLLLKRLSNHRMQVLEIEDDQQSYGSIRTTWKTTKMRDFVTFFENLTVQLLSHGRESELVMFLAANAFLLARCWIAHKCSCLQMNLPKDSRKQESQWTDLWLPPAVLV
ncbi:thiosulfate/3-mercaptopyruvate sulfurtransferase 2-like isoform X2 [Musa acuminata AAA Group]|uniref:thiosulfate/3-mercaptopyruvate sulfurtransferase 2-like isoform X2 n=1 Tax=Musa acuminata AAA Group TaxID=214697 RepID=UPI0031D1AB17